jgi:hypothetical protein
MNGFRIVETDNYGGDYPDEKFILGWIPTRVRAQLLVDAINSEFCPSGLSRRFYKVVELPYELQPGFEP